MAAADRRNLERDDELVRTADRRAIAGIEGVERNAPQRPRRSSSTTVASAAAGPAGCRPPARHSRRCRRSSRGSESAPPPTSRAAATSIGSRLRTSGERMMSVKVASAPIDSTFLRDLDRAQRVQAPEIQEPRVLQGAEIERRRRGRCSPPAVSSGPSSRNIRSASGSDCGSSEWRLDISPASGTLRRLNRSIDRLSSLCSGTDCPRGPLRIASSDGFRPSATAAMIIPGVQMPHCAPPSATNARCSRCLPPRPSMVVTLRAVGVRRRHEARVHRQRRRSGSCRRRTRLRRSPPWCPVNPQSSRRTSSSRFIGCTARGASACRSASADHASV